MIDFNILRTYASNVYKILNIFNSRVTEDKIVTKMGFFEKLNFRRELAIKTLKIKNFI